MIAKPTPPDRVVYPSSDGKPMAENTLQYQWIVTLQGNIDALLAANPDVFVAGDNLIYPVQGRVDIRTAPDVYVAFGRPKGHRGSYQVWLEGGIFPQVVFEVLSPGNRAAELRRKLRFYELYGAEEYYIYDPDRVRLTGYTRQNNRLVEVPEMNQFVSPRLGIRFDMNGDELVVYTPTGERFLTQAELFERARAEAHRADEATRRADETARRADAAEAKAARRAAKLRELGLDPNGD